MADLDPEIVERAADRSAMPVGPDIQVTFNLYQMAGLRVLVQREISAIERHHRVIGGNHHEYLEQLRGVLTAMISAAHDKGE